MALHQKGFTSPTKIQATALPFALAGRDVVGVAQTVGISLRKGLGLRLICAIFSRDPAKRLHTDYLSFIIYCRNLALPEPRKRPVRALVLCPTRELALQVSSHLNALLTSAEFSKMFLRLGQKIHRSQVLLPNQPFRLEKSRRPMSVLPPLLEECLRKSSVASLIEVSMFLLLPLDDFGTSWKRCAIQFGVLL